MTNESHTDWWNQYLKSDDPDHVVVQMDKEIELLRDQRDSNMAKEVERIASLTTQRDEYKVWWERDSTSLGKALNEVSSLRAVREESRAAIEQLHAAVKTAQELAATRLMEIGRLSKREKNLMDVIDSRDRALGFVPLDEVHASEPRVQRPTCGYGPCIAVNREGWHDSHCPTQGASRDASPADLVGALQDVVHTDPGPVRAGRATREWHFDRYRGGKLMAQGVKVHAPNYADAYEKAVTMLFTDGNKPTDELRLSQRT